MRARYKLRLSAAADDDLDKIYEYGILQWGERQADRYFDQLVAHLDQLANNPFLYAAIDDIRPGYRRSVCGSHSVYYRVRDDRVEVMAIIGGQEFGSRPE